MGDRLTEIFMSLFCEKNSDGTKHLRLKGKDLYQRIGKRLKGPDMDAVANFLNKHPEINSIDLCYNDIGDLGLEILAEKYFRDKNSLIHLNIMSCDVTYFGLSKLYRCFKFLNLQTLRLTGNKFGTKGGEYIAKLIEDVKSLKLIEMGDTDQTLSSIDTILNKAKSSEVQVLDISRVIPKTSYDQLNPQWLAKNLGIFLELNSTLTELIVQKCEMDGHDVERLLQGLWRNKSLRMLNLGANGICCYGVELISKWLDTNPSLLGLDISCNGIKDSGARALSISLPKSKIKYLNVCDNKIADNGMAGIFDTLKKPFMLRLFYFWGNPFGIKTKKILRRMLISKILKQEYIDVKLYEVDGVLCSAYYGQNHYKHKYYSVMDYGCPTELKIKRNKIEEPDKKHRPFYHIYNYERYPRFDD